MSEGIQSPVFVGRRDEVALLVALLERARGGEPGVAIIAGEAGVGKTRLAGELSGHAADAGFTVLTGHCVELGAEGLPLAPLIDALRTLARTTPADELAEVLGPARRGLGRLLPELDPQAVPAQDAVPETAVGGIQLAQLLELVLGLLGRLSARRPLMLVFEDLHWADQSTRELVAFLVRSLRGVSVLLLVTYRSDELNRRHPLRPLVASWERLRSAERLELRRFDHAEVAAQLGAIFAAIGVGGLLGTALAGRASRGSRPRLVLAGALLAAGLPTMLLAVTHWPAAAIVLTGLTGMGALLVEIMTDTGLQRMLDEDVFGRAYGLAIPASLGGIVAGSLIAPVLANTLGGSGALVAVGGAVLAYAALVLHTPAASRGTLSSAQVVAGAVPSR